MQSAGEKRRARPGRELNRSGLSDPEASGVCPDPAPLLRLENSTPGSEQGCAGPSPEPGPAPGLLPALEGLQGPPGALSLSSASAPPGGVLQRPHTRSPRGRLPRRWAEVTGDYAHSDGSHVPVRSCSVPWGGGGRWERRPWSGGAAVRRGGGRRGGWREWGSPSSRALSQAAWGAWRAPLGPAVNQSCSAHLSAVAPPPPQAPPALFQEKHSGHVRGRKRRRRGKLGGETRVLLAGRGTRFPLASPGHLWARPLGELSQ